MFPIPFNESHRLDALKSYDVLDTSPEAPFDNLTRLAREHFGVATALVSLVDQTRLWFKSVQGPDVQQTCRDLALCSHAILSDEPLIVLDATQDKRFSTNPLVCGPPRIRFYAGAPLITCEGFRLGTFCIINCRPRMDFHIEEIDTLKNFAQATMQLLELRRGAGAYALGQERGAMSGHRSSAR